MAWYHSKNEVSRKQKSILAFHLTGFNAPLNILLTRLWIQRDYSSSRELNQVYQLSYSFADSLHVGGLDYLILCLKFGV